ncbi:proliferating cell nuclear antigen [Chiua virens]|nr:proliferating cell nuclear antigen [Chiua virens]
MLEAKLEEAALLKRLLESVKELVTDANFVCDEEGIKLQAMDNSHVALVAVHLEVDGFKKFRCDRPMPLGVNLNSLSKVLKCAKDDDICTIKASDDADVLNLMYEAKSSILFPSFPTHSHPSRLVSQIQDRIAEYDMKLMDIDSENLGIPDTDYDARVTMTSSEFARIVKDLSQLGESVRVEVSKEGVRFVSEGEAANGSILLKQTEAAREKYENYEEKPKKKKTKKEKVKKEEKEDGDVEMNGDGDDDGEFKAKSDDEGEEEQDEDEDGKPKSKKRKKAASKNGQPSKKAKKSDEIPSDGGVYIEMNQHVSLTFSLKYLVNFSKSSSLSNTVQLMMSNEVPLLVSYKFGQGVIKYYLAPKIGEE